MSSRNYRLKLSRSAQKDISNIVQFTAEKWGSTQAINYRGKLDDALRALVQNPMFGHASPQLPNTHRLYIVGSHTIVYQIQDDIVYVLRILHQRMSIPNHI